MEHQPDDWKVVAQATNQVIIMAMCKCGDNNCYFTASVGHREIVHIQPPQVQEVWCHDCGVEMFEEDIDACIEQTGIFKGICVQCVEQRAAEGEQITVW